MNKTLLLFLFICMKSFSQSTEYIERQGEVTFFSYTSVENIQAKNSQTLSILNPKTRQIAVQILMRAFVFQKSLMHEHFNASYIESDLYPKATFEGEIENFNANDALQTKLIKGTFTLRNISKPIEIKATISKADNSYTIKGSLDVLINDYNIKVPALLSPNISKKIEITFNFNYAPYEN